MLYFSLTAPLNFTKQMILTMGMREKRAPATQLVTPAASAFCPIVTQGTNHVTQPVWGWVDDQTSGWEHLSSIRDEFYNGNSNDSYVLQLY